MQAICAEVTEFRVFTRRVLTVSTLDAGALLARARLLEMNFPKSPLVRRPGFSLEKNGFTRVKSESRLTETEFPHTETEIPAH